MNEIEFQLRLHKQLCETADTILYFYDACGFAKDGCYAGEFPAKCCHKTRFARTDGDEACVFLGPHGCQNENIECKCYLCDTAKMLAEPKLLRSLAMLEIMAKEFELIV